MLADCTQHTGVVVIGRNEGERLRLCLKSVIALAHAVVYVDSGSTDASVATARSLGVTVVELDMTRPFTAARARNAGVERLRGAAADLKYVQFVDGDCVVATGWLQVAADFLEQHPEIAVVCGRRRERFPQHSIYNALCDIEWNTPVGETAACGGDALMRIDAFTAVGGFRADLIAGEEPELCVRLRARGWKIWRLDCEMTLHDAAMTRFGQWWRRSVRGGHAFAEGAALHGGAPVLHWVRESRSAWLWGLVIPAAIVVLTSLFGPPLLLLLLIYPLQVIRLALRQRLAFPLNWWRAGFLVFGKFPEACGQLQYWRNRLGHRTNTLIEYK
jgi:glycosyltransferase involved in cell wall biosynthesis